MSQEMYELFKTVSSVLFYGLALFIIIRNVLKIRENKKQKKREVNYPINYPVSKAMKRRISHQIKRVDRISYRNFGRYAGFGEGKRTDKPCV